MASSIAELFTPFSLSGVTLPNRIVMAPMTRNFSPGGVPGPDVAAYYRRRAQGGTGLILTEGTSPDHPQAANMPQIPHMYGEEALAGWKVRLSAMALAENPSLSTYSDLVEDSGEGRWTVGAAIETAVPADVLSASLFARFRSRREHSFADRLLSAMRFKFGGHVEPKTGE